MTNHIRRTVDEVAARELQAAQIQTSGGYMLSFVRGSVCTLVALLASLAAAPLLARVDVEAYPGVPFGVGRITATVQPGNPNAHEAQAYSLRDADGRVLYPVFTQGKFLNIVRGIFGGETAPGDDTPRTITAHFLFRGDRPLRLTFSYPTTETVDVEVRQNPRAHQRLVRQWWRDYSGTLTEHQQSGEYPTLVDVYCASMLARRLGLEAPLLARPITLPTDEPARTFQLLMGTEALRDQVIRDSFSADPARARVAEQATRPLPPPVRWLEPQVPALPPGTPEPVVEPLAMHVPEECFYIRFGTFDNYLWFRRLSEEYGGDLGRMITLRGQDPQLSKRQETQLALKESALAGLFGNQVIADVAFIGRDTFLPDGAAVGMLFQAKQNDILKNDFTSQRAAALAREKDRGAKLEMVRIAGREVSFLSTPDNRLRSFWAVDGNFNLVTTSSAIVERFFAAGAGDRPLGATAGFRNARRIMPEIKPPNPAVEEIPAPGQPVPNPGYTVFAYFSPQFFQGLMSPQYRVELRRRTQAVVDMELLAMAELAARAEGLKFEMTSDLVRAGLLPPGFESRPDDSHPIVARPSQAVTLVDSLRGARGSFLPIPDVKILGVTASEERECEGIRDYFAARWPQMDPIVVGMRRFSLDKEKGLERVVIDAEVAPFTSEKYGWLTQYLGPPRREMLAPVPGDVASAQVVMRSGNGDISHLFAGLRNETPTFTLGGSGIFEQIRMLRGIPSYLGAWPKPGLLDLLPFNLGGTQADANGYSKLPFGLWRRQWQGWSVLSFQPQVLAEITPQLGFEVAEKGAQVRLRVADLSAAQAAASVNGIAYLRARETSLGNARFLHGLSEQLHVPRATALKTAEQLLNTKFVCALGGEYQLIEDQTGLEQWRSTAWGPPATQVPPEFRAPLLAWLRAAKADAVLDGNRLYAHAEIDMQRKAEDKPKFELPNFGDFFGGAKAKKPELPKEGSEFPAPKPAGQRAANPGTKREF